MDPAGPALHRSVLLRAYAAYNAQDIEGLLILVSDDVDWPNGEAGRLRGKDEVRAYWSEQWIRTRTHDTPVGLTQQADGRTAVQIDQVVRTLDGQMISEGRLVHLHRLVDGRIARLDIELAENP